MPFPLKGNGVIQPKHARGRKGRGSSEKREGRRNFKTDRQSRGCDKMNRGTFRRGQKKIRSLIGKKGLSRKQCYGWSDPKGKVKRGLGNLSISQNELTMGIGGGLVSINILRSSFGD